MGFEWCKQGRRTYGGHLTGSRLGIAAGYMMAGDLTKRMDPYFPFEKSVEMWGRSFSKLGISYKSATMDLDLLDRKGKYSNGVRQLKLLSSSLLKPLCPPSVSICFSIYIVRWDKF